MAAYRESGTDETMRSDTSSSDIINKCKSQKRILSLSGFNAVIFARNCTQLGDTIKMMQSDSCQPIPFLIAAATLLPLSLILQSLHALATVVYQKPNDDNDFVAMERYRQKLMWENGLAAVVVLLNMAIDYAVVGQIDEFDRETCSFH